MITVTCYYTIPSKQSKEFYYENIKRFFRKLNWQKIYFFTDNHNYNNLKAFAGKNVEFVIKDFEHIPIFKDFSPDFWKEELLNDPEKYHTWQLGALWACKSYFIKEVSLLNPNSDWLMWVDAGCVRTDRWNLGEFTKRNTIVEPGVYLQLLTVLPKTQFFKYGGGSYIAGSHILFHKEFIDEYIEMYKQTVTNYIENKYCIVDDQYILASMANSSKFIKSVLYNNLPCPDRWFFFFNII